MAMSDYEPESGWNLPPGCFEEDINAYFDNRDALKGKTCGDCAWCTRCESLKGDSIYICTADSGDLREIDPEDCVPEEGCFEARW